jgi:hypothetical protein
MFIIHKRNLKKLCLIFDLHISLFTNLVDMNSKNKVIDIFNNGQLRFKFGNSTHSNVDAAGLLTGQNR